MSDHVWKITPPMSRKSTFTDDPEEVAFIRKSDGYTITEYRATPTPPVEPVKEADVSAIRDAALEEAAKMCDEYGDDYMVQAREGDNTGASDHKACAAVELADAIRALRGSTP